MTTILIIIIAVLTIAIILLLASCIGYHQELGRCKSERMQAEITAGHWLRQATATQKENLKLKAGLDEIEREVYGKENRK